MDLLTVGAAAEELTEELAVEVRPRWISALYYSRELRHDLCPVVGGRRLIPRTYLPMIASALRRHGWVQ